MKINIFIIILLLSSAFLTTAQTSNNQSLYIGMNAPSFAAQSTTGAINFPNDYYNKWKILFGHPADFTPVCSSEIIALAEKQDEFKKLNTALLVVSTDGLNSHIEWIKSLESINIPGKAPVKIGIPLIADINLDIAKKYNMLRKDTTDRRNIRSVVFVDPDNKIRAIFVYPDIIGRNVDEIIRTLTALQLADKNDVLTPANWKPGDDVLLHSPKSIEESNKLKSKSNPDFHSWTWFMWFKKL